MSERIARPANCGDEQVLGTAYGCLPSSAEAHAIDDPADWEKSLPPRKGPTV